MTSATATDTTATYTTATYTTATDTTTMTSTTLTTSTTGTETTTMTTSTTATSLTETTTTFFDYIPGPRVSNLAYMYYCLRTASASQLEAEKACSANETCFALHDEDCDGVDWRYCTARDGCDDSTFNRCTVTVDDLAVVSTGREACTLEFYVNPVTASTRSTDTETLTVTATTTTTDSSTTTLHTVTLTSITGTSITGTTATTLKMTATLTTTSFVSSTQTSTATVTTTTMTTATTATQTETSVTTSVTSTSATTTSVTTVTATMTSITTVTFATSTDSFTTTRTTASTATTSATPTSMTSTSRTGTTVTTATTTATFTSATGTLTTVTSVSSTTPTTRSTVTGTSFTTWTGESVLCVDGLPTSTIGVNISACLGLYSISRCMVGCREGYEGQEAEYTCMEDGRFHGSGPTCAKVTCSAGVPDGYGSTCDNIEAGGYCAVHCPPGTDGPPALFSCENNGSYTGVPPICGNLSCSAGSLPAGLGVNTSDCFRDDGSGATITVGQLCAASCDPGYEGEPSRLECGEAGDFVAVDILAACDVQQCPAGSLDLGNFTHTCGTLGHGQSCLVRCGEGFEGTAQAFVCEAGNLSGVAPNCSGVPCSPDFGPSVNGSACVGKTTGEVCVPTCNHGYEPMMGSLSEFVCGTDGFFMGSLECVRAQCDDLSMVEGFDPATAEHSCAGSVFGESCSVWCAAGYDIVGPVLALVCAVPGYTDLQTGEAAVKPTCVGRPCAQSFAWLPRGVVHDCGGKVTGETCTASAEPGYGYSVGAGPTTLTCGTDGLFHGPVPDVVLEPCPPPDFAGTEGVHHTCDGKGLGEFCWAYCQISLGSIGRLARYECRRESNGSLAFAAVGAPVACLEFAAGPRTSNNFAPFCGNENSDLSTMQARCFQAAGECAILHDYNCDGRGYRACTGTTSIDVLQALGPDTLACTMVAVATGAGAALSRALLPEEGNVSAPQANCDAGIAALGLDAPSISHNCLGLSDSQICVASCARGYALDGDIASVFRCDGGLEHFMGPSLPSCAPLPCNHSYPRGLGVEDTCGGVGTNSTCAATCGSGYGYSMGAAETVYTCTTTGDFAGVPPTCEPLPCGALMLPGPEYSAQCDTTATGQRCVLDCAAGWTNSGEPALLTCNATGSYSPYEPPTCVPNVCTEGVPSDSCANLTTGQTCMVACAEGFTGSPRNLTCSSTGEVVGLRPVCTPVVCPVPVHLAAAEVLHDCDEVAFGGKCGVHCTDGYALATGGSAEEWACAWNSTAEAAELQGELPQCEPKPCRYNLPVGDGIAHNCSGARTGETCVARCGPGYEGAPETFMCNGDGALSGVAPSCERARCSGGPTAHEVVHTCDGIEFQSTCVVSCGPGYSGTAEIWSCELVNASIVAVQGDLPACSPQRCLDNVPMGLQYDAQECAGVTTGGSCSVRCAEEDYVGHPENFTCIGGVFDGTLPDCAVRTTSTATGTSTSATSSTTPTTVTETRTNTSTTTTGTNTSTTATRTATATTLTMTETSNTSTATTSTSTATHTSTSVTIETTNTSTTATGTTSQTFSLTSATSGTNTTTVTETTSQTTSLTSATSGTNTTATATGTLTATTLTNSTLTMTTPTMTTLSDSTLSESTLTTTTLTMSTATESETSASSTASSVTTTGTATTLTMTTRTTTHPDTIIRLQGNVVMEVNNAAQFIAEPSSPAAVAEGISSLVGVPSNYTTVSLRPARRRLTPHVLAGERRLQSGSVQADYVVDLPANDPNANEASATANLQAARDDPQLATAAINSGIQNQPNLTGRYTATATDVSEVSVSTLAPTTTVQDTPPPPPQDVQDDEVFAGLVNQLNRAKDFAEDEPIIAAAVGGSVLVCCCCCCLVCCCRCCRKRWRRMQDDEDDLDSLEEGDRDDPGAAAPPVAMPAVPGNLEPADDREDAPEADAADDPEVGASQDNDPPATEI